ncbi:fibronectin type III domain-containing protein [Natrinema salaciae]|nr:fibronectin type III domain-containing protein [Natrinema salaciae]
MTRRDTREDRRTERTNSETASSGAAEARSRRSVLRAGAIGASALALGGVSTAAAQSIERETCGDWDTFELGDGHWHLMNNKWGMPNSEQCIRVYDDGRYGYQFSAVGDGINYPEAFCGGRPWGADTGIPELPTRRGDIDELVLEFDVDVDIGGGEWDLAEEWWLLDGERDSENPPITHEIMLVLDWGGGHDHYMEEEDVLTDQFGNQIDHWADYDREWTFHIFRIAGGASTGQVDLAAIGDYLTDEHGVSEDLTLTGVEVGNEYWAGASGEVTYTSLDLTVDGTTYESGLESDAGPTPPASPDDVWTNEVTATTIELGWTSVDAATTYDVTLDGDRRTTTSEPTATIANLTPGTTYEVGVAAGNDGGWSPVVETTVTTDDATETIQIGEHEARDPDGDGLYDDVDGDGQTTHADVNAFYEHLEADGVQENPDAFDFDGNGRVGFADVLDLLRRV